MNWHGETVVVTGGAGFIGSKLVKRLTKYGANVVVIDNFSTGKKHKLRDVQCRIVESNVVSVNHLKSNKIPSPDFIFHLGAPSSDVLFRENPTKCLLEAINGFTEVLEFAKKHQAKKLIYTSSSSVYGKTPTPQSENSPTQPTNLYGAAKLVCENIAQHTPDVKSVGLRIFAGYGPGEEHKGKIASIVTLFLYNILSRKKPIVYGDGSQKRDFVYIDDIVDALIISGETNVEGIINVGTGQSYSFMELLNVLMERLGNRLTPIFVPKPEGYFDRTQAEVSKMKNCLEIKPITLKDGLEQYIQLVQNKTYQAHS